MGTQQRGVGQRREELGSGKVPAWATVLYPMLQPGREKEHISSVKLGTGRGVTVNDCLAVTGKEQVLR